jgi:hypothetical protein
MVLVVGCGVTQTVVGTVLRFVCVEMITRGGAVERTVMDVTETTTERLVIVLGGSRTVIATVECAVE